MKWQEVEGGCGGRDAESEGERTGLIYGLMLWLPVKGGDRLEDNYLITAVSN